MAFRLRVYLSANLVLGFWKMCRPKMLLILNNHYKLYTDL